MRHKHWIIGNWHISVDCVNDRWAWRADDLANSLEPIVLAGKDLSAMHTALVEALDIIAAFEAIGVSAVNARWTRELSRDDERIIPPAVLDPDVTDCGDAAPLDWFDLPDDD